jgi:AraC-like DNA-binding protein
MSQQIYRSINYSGVELRCGSGTLDYAPHLHDGYSIGLLTQGHQNMRTGRRSEEISAGSVLFHEPYEVHENRRLDSHGFSFKNIEISQDRLLQVMDGRRPPPPSNIHTDVWLFQSFLKAFEALAGDDDALAQDALLTGALSRLFSSRSAGEVPAVAPGAVVAARDYLHANFMSPVTLDSLVEVTQVSRVHISRIFKRHIGLAPHEYLIQLRVADAKTRLAAGVPVADVAALSGFADQSHLTRHFKRITHLTPGAYVRSCYKRSRPWRESPVRS